jgi:tetrahydrodipicolinate N-succinyltransferase
MTTATPQSLKPYVLGDFGVQGTQQALQQVSQQKKAQQNVRPICPITNETIPKGRLYVADCLHAFDTRAITEWVVLQKHLTCPLCRRRTVGFHLPLTNQNYVGNRHVNRSTTTKGGWVAHTATVSLDATVGFHCKVTDNAKVLDHATLKDHAIVMEDAIVKNKASIEGRSMVADHACITDNAVIKGESMVSGHATVGGHASVNNSVIAGRARIGGTAKIIDAMVLRRNETMME